MTPLSPSDHAALTADTGRASAAPVTHGMREREDISRADASAARCFVDRDARILSAAFDCLARLAQAEIDLAYGRFCQPFRMPGASGADGRGW